MTFEILLSMKYFIHVRKYIMYMLYTYYKQVYNCRLITHERSIEFKFWNANSSAEQKRNVRWRGRSCIKAFTNMMDGWEHNNSRRRSDSRGGWYNTNTGTTSFWAPVPSWSDEELRVPTRLHYWCPSSSGSTKVSIPPSPINQHPKSLNLC